VLSECNAEGEQSVVNGEATTTGTEQNMTLAGEIGEAANPADPATDTTNIEGTNQNGNTTLGTDSVDDVLYGNSSAAMAMTTWTEAKAGTGWLVANKATTSMAQMASQAT
jgi:hypothetical protein